MSPPNLDNIATELIEFIAHYVCADSDGEYFDPTIQPPSPDFLAFRLTCRTLAASSYSIIKPYFEFVRVSVEPQSFDRLLQFSKNPTIRQYIREVEFYVVYYNGNAALSHVAKRRRGYKPKEACRDRAVVSGGRIARGQFLGEYLRAMENKYTIKRPVNYMVDTLTEAFKSLPNCASITILPHDFLTPTLGFRSKGPRFPRRNSMLDHRFIVPECKVWVALWGKTGVWITTTQVQEWALNLFDPGPLDLCDSDVARRVLHAEIDEASNTISTAVQMSGASIQCDDEWLVGKWAKAMYIGSGKL